TAWCLSPEKALRFKQFKKAFKMLESFELSDRAMIVAAFDIGKQIMISSPNQEPMMADTDNPFRKFAEILNQ
ncbi:hypothetical protein EAY03_25565, partial [Vibrio anguillarum]|nr:hypothetical protein [Vibrio anguillarum]